MKIGCVLMAAGTASRFGENKLLYPIEGRPLIQRALDAAPAGLFARAVAVVSSPEVETMVRQAGYESVVNPDPARGQGTSIVLGMQEMNGMDAALLRVADQPYLTQASVERMLAAYRPGDLVALAYGGKRGNPVLFPSDCFDALALLSPAETGRVVLSQYADRLILVEADSARELMDIDTREDVRKAESGHAD